MNCCQNDIYQLGQHIEHIPEIHQPIVVRLCLDDYEFICPSDISAEKYIDTLPLAKYQNINPYTFQYINNQTHNYNDKQQILLKKLEDERNKLKKKNMYLEEMKQKLIKKNEKTKSDIKLILKEEYKLEVTK